MIVQLKVRGMKMPPSAEVGEELEENMVVLNTASLFTMPNRQFTVAYFEQLEHTCFSVGSKYVT